MFLQWYIPEKIEKHVFLIDTFNSMTHHDFFVHCEKDIEPRFLKFVVVKTTINNARFKSEYNYHLEIRNLYNQSKQIYYKTNTNDSILGTLDVIQHRPYTVNGITFPYRKVCTFLRTFKYSEGFSELLQHPEYSNSYRLRVKADPIEGKSYIYIYIYIDRQVLLKIYDNERIPTLINKILSNSEYLVEPEKKPFPRYNDLSQFNIDVGQINLRVPYNRKPFPHQAKNIQWMIDQETKVDTNLLTITGIRTPQQYESRYIESIGETLYYDKTTGRIIDSTTLPEFCARVKGGILADDIGLGKTMSCIGLISEQNLVHPQDQTLVICPSRLCKQWSDEIQLSVGSRISSIVIGTIHQFKRFLKSPNSYHVVILSYNFLVNDSYKIYLQGQQLSATQSESGNDTRDVGFNFTEKVWGRVILDEGHEFLKKFVPKRYQFTSTERVNIDIRDTLLNLKSKYYWVCSGTPYRDSEKEDIYYLLKFITGGDINLAESDISQDKNEHFVVELFHHIFRKNRHDGVDMQLNIPEPVFKTQFLKMTSFEKRMYNSVEGDREKMIQYCNHILVSEEYNNVLGNEPLSLEQIHTKMTTYFKNQVDKFTRRIEICQEEITKLSIPGQLQNSDKIHDLQEKIRLTQNDLNANKAKYNLFNQIDTRVEEFQNCPICYNEMGVNSVTSSAITICGHFFCTNCMKELFGNCSGFCPICRYSLKKDDITVIGNEETDQEQVINKYGTKMAHLISYLLEVTAISYQRVIVFAQYDSLLQLVGRTLNEYGIKYIVFNGSISTVTGRIRKFKIDDSIKVALMSSERAPSGLNLTEASHIVLLDTLNTDRESAKVIEAQAIGRAVRIGQKSRVEIKRFIMLDTIEHEYYLRNLGISNDTNNNNQNGSGLPKSSLLDCEKLEDNPFSDEIFEEPLHEISVQVTGTSIVQTDNMENEISEEPFSSALQLTHIELCQEIIG